jgi:hypothetical protein
MNPCVSRRVNISAINAEKHAVMSVVMMGVAGMSLVVTRGVVKLVAIRGVTEAIKEIDFIVYF